MKKVIFFSLFFSLFVFCQTYAQTSREPTLQEKQALNPIIDAAFDDWSYSWSYDKYVNQSTKVTKLKINEDYGTIETHGTFSYRRLATVFSGTFVANINSSGKLISLSYRDANGQSDSKSF